MSYIVYLQSHNYKIFNEYNKNVLTSVSSEKKYNTKKIKLNTHNNNSIMQSTINKIVDTFKECEKNVFLFKAGLGYYKKKKLI